MFVKLKQKKGITLIEMVISVLILGMALGAMLGTFVMGRISATKAKHHIEAINLARARMEWIKDQSYAGLPRGVATVTTAYPYQIVPVPFSDNPSIDVGKDVDNDGNLDNDGDELIGSRITQIKPIGTPEQYLEVTITVTWTERLLGGGSQQASENLVTLISE